MIRLFKKVARKLMGRQPGWDHLVARGLRLGRNVHIGTGTFIDPDHCWLISIEDEVRIAPRVILLAHDASTKHPLGYTRLGLVKIGRGAFIGAGAIIMPGVSIGDNAIVGAGSIVTRDVESNSVVAGNPATLRCSLDQFAGKHQEKMKAATLYPAAGWTVDQGIDDTRKTAMKADLQVKAAYIE